MLQLVLRMQSTPRRLNTYHRYFLFIGRPHGPKCRWSSVRDSRIRWSSSWRHRMTPRRQSNRLVTANILAQEIQIITKLLADVYILHKYRQTSLLWRLFYSTISRFALLLCCFLIVFTVVICMLTLLLCMIMVYCPVRLAATATETVRRKWRIGGARSASSWHALVHTQRGMTITLLALIDTPLYTPNAVWLLHFLSLLTRPCTHPTRYDCYTSCPCLHSIRLHALSFLSHLHQPGYSKFQTFQWCSSCLLGESRFISAVFSMRRRLKPPCF